jgi:hypothetical protein
MKVLASSILIIVWTSAIGPAIAGVIPYWLAILICVIGIFVNGFIAVFIAGLFVPPEQFSQAVLKAAEEPNRGSPKPNQVLR